MPLLRRDDPGRQGDPHDRRPTIPEPVRRRLAVPVGQPYTYCGTGLDELTPELDGDPATCVAPMRALSRLALLDVCEAIDGPGWFDWWDATEDGAA